MLTLLQCTPLLIELRRLLLEESVTARFVPVLAEAKSSFTRTIANNVSVHPKCGNQYRTRVASHAEQTARTSLAAAHGHRLTRVGVGKRPAKHGVEVRAQLGHAGLFLLSAPSIGLLSSIVLGSSAKSCHLFFDRIKR